MIREFLRNWGIEFRRFPVWLHIFNALCATALFSIALAGALALRSPAPPRFVEQGRLRHADAVRAIVRSEGVEALEYEVRSAGPELRDELLSDLSRIPHPAARRLILRLSTTIEIPAAPDSEALEPIIALLGPPGLDRDLAVLVLVESREPGRLAWLARSLRLETGPTVDRSRPGALIRAAAPALTPPAFSAPRLEAAALQRHPAKPSRAEVAAALEKKDAAARLRFAILCATPLEASEVEATLAVIADLRVSDGERERLTLATLLYRAPDADLEARLSGSEARLPGLAKGLTLAPRPGLSAALWSAARRTKAPKLRDDLTLAAASCGSEEARTTLTRRLSSDSPGAGRLRKRLRRLRPEVPRELHALIAGAAPSSD